MSKIVKYKEDLFRIHLRENGKIVLSSSDGRKAQKYGMTVNQGIGYYLTVPANEVEELYDGKYYRRKLFNLDIKFREYLLSLSWPEEYPVSQELKKEFKENNIKISGKAIISKLNSKAWWIEDGKNQYTIGDFENKLRVRNGGII